MSPVLIAVPLIVVIAAAGTAPISAPVTDGGEFRVNTATAGDQDRPSVARAPGGAFVVVWQSYGQDGSGFGIRAQRYDSAGGALGAEFGVNTHTTNDQRRPDVAVDGAGNFVVVWQSYAQDGSGYGVFGQRFDSGGGPLGGEFQVNTHTPQFQRYPSVAMTGAGEFVVVWSSFGQDGDALGIFGQRFASGGGALGGEFQANVTTTFDQERPAVAMAPGGGFVVVWQSYAQDGSAYGVIGRRFDSSGTPAGGEFQVNTHTTGGQYSPAVDGDAAGGFVVVWDSYGQDGAGFGVFGQRYDSSGAADGGEFQVNTYTTSNQSYPGLAVETDGAFVVAWSSYSQEGLFTGYGVFARQFDVSGAPAGGEFQVNTETSLNQFRATAATDGAGNFVVAWSSYGQDQSGYGVFAQAYCAPLVVSPPASQTACEGTPASFSVTATGKGPFAYQWRKDGGNLSDGGSISGATTPTLTIDPVAGSDAGSYDCVVTDGCGNVQTVVSAAASLTVFPVPGTVTLLMLEKSGGDLKFTWTDTTDADDYVVREDPLASGGFGTITGTAPDGTTGLTIPMPSGTRHYLVAGRNADCGEGPLH